MSARPTYKDGYLRVGDTSEFMEAAIDITDAHLLRDAVVTQLFDDERLNLLRLGGTQNRTNNLALFYKARAGVKTRSIPTPEFIDEPSIFMGASLSQFSDGRWHMHIVRNRFSRDEENSSQRRLSTHYKIVCSDSEVIEANRTVKHFRISLASIALKTARGSLDLEESTDYKRVGFTSPIQPEDCKTMTNFITHHCARIRIERGL